MIKANLIVEWLNELQKTGAKAIGGDADFMADDQEAIIFHQPTITAYAGLVRRLFCSSLYGVWFAFSFFGWHLAT